MQRPLLLAAAAAGLAATGAAGADAGVQALSCTTQVATACALANVYWSGNLLSIRVCIGGTVLPCLPGVGLVTAPLAAPPTAGAVCRELHVGSSAVVEACVVV